MNTIQMVDLYSQHLHIKAELDQALDRVIRDSAFIQGQEVAHFQNELASFLEVKHVIGCANGTDALQVALMALEFPQGSEIIVPTFNYVAAVEVIALLGLVPVFIEAHPEHFNMDVTHLESLITDKTRAIIPVHLFGQCVEMDKVMEIARKHNLYVIEDNAQAIGAQYTSASGKTSYAGTIGHIGTTSFFPSKNLGCMGDGGAIFTNDDTLAQKIRMIANHGQRVKYVYEKVGVNSRLDTLQAAILRVKLRYLEQYIAARQQAAAHYDRALAGVPGIKTPTRFRQSTQVFHQYTLQLDSEALRDEMKTFLAAQGVPSMIYYPVPLHLQQAYAYLRKEAGTFPVAERLSKSVLSLPMHTELSAAQLQHICNAVAEKRVNQVVQ